MDAKLQPVERWLSFPAHLIHGDVRVHTRYKNGSCEKSCMIEQEPILQCVNSLLPQ